MNASVPVSETLYGDYNPQSSEGGPLFRTGLPHIADSDSFTRDGYSPLTHSSKIFGDGHTTVNQSPILGLVNAKEVGENTNHLRQVIASQSETMIVQGPNSSNSNLNSSSVSDSNTNTSEPLRMNFNNGKSNDQLVVVAPSMESSPSQASDKVSAIRDLLT